MAERRYRAAGGVVISDGHILLLDRPDRNEVRLPKGHIEEGESAPVAAVRETCEESGYRDLLIVADLGSQIVEFDYAGDHIVRSEHYFLMHLGTDRRVKRSQKDAAQFHPQWVPLEHAADRLTFSTEQDVVRRAIDAESARPR